MWSTNFLKLSTIWSSLSTFVFLYFFYEVYYKKNMFLVRGCVWGLELFLVLKYFFIHGSKWPRRPSLYPSVQPTCKNTHTQKNISNGEAPLRKVMKYQVGNEVFSSTAKHCLGSLFTHKTTQVLKLQSHKQHKYKHNILNQMVGWVRSAYCITLTVWSARRILQPANWPQWADLHVSNSPLYIWLSPLTAWEYHKNLSSSLLCSLAALTSCFFFPSG